MLCARSSSLLECLEGLHATHDSAFVHEGGAVLHSHVYLCGGRPSYGFSVSISSTASLACALGNDLMLQEEKLLACLLLIGVLLCQLMHTLVMTPGCSANCCIRCASILHVIIMVASATALKLLLLLLLMFSYTCIVWVVTCNIHNISIELRHNLSLGIIGDKNIDLSLERHHIATIQSRHLLLLPLLSGEAWAGWTRGWSHGDLLEGALRQSAVNPFDMAETSSIHLTLPVLNA